MRIALALVALLAGAAQADTVDLAASDAQLFRVFGDDAHDLLGGGHHDGINFGDIDGDGIDDFIIGAYRGNGAKNDAENAGEVYVVFGRPGLKGTTLDLDTDGKVTPAGEMRIYGEDPEDYFGRPVAAGDVNGDGFDDIVIGAFLADGKKNGNVDAGEVFVFYGGPKARGTFADLKAGGAVSQWGETRIIGDDKYDSTGYSVATGDINADGFADIVFGAIGADDFDGEKPTAGGTPDGDKLGGSPGRVYIVYGRADLSGKTIDLDTNGPVSAAKETRIVGERGVAGAAGVSVKCGDVDGDGFDDVIFGASFLEPGKRETAGGAFVVYGSAELPGKLVLLGAEDTTTSFRETRIYGGAAKELFGHCIGAGDVDGDGRSDIIVGATAASPAGRKNAGTTFVFRGGPELRGRVFDLSKPDAFPAASLFRLHGGAETDSLGLIVGTADTNGDGFDDLYAAAPNHSEPDRQYCGAVLAALGGSGFFERELSEPDREIVGAIPVHAIGFGLEGGGDIDGDGVEEVAFASISYDSPKLAATEKENDVGEGMVLFGNDSGTTATVVRFARGGDAPPLRFGALGVAVDFAAGDGPTRVSVSRTPHSVAHVRPFRVEYARNAATGRIAATLPPEAAGEHALMHGATPAGPWVPLANARWNPARHEASGDLSGSGWYAAIRKAPGSPQTAAPPAKTASPAG